VGGIPVRTKLIKVALTPQTNAAAAIQAAINSAKPGDVVSLPAGTFKLTAGIGIPTAKSGITLRGAPDGQTRLEVQPGVTNPITVGTGFSYNYPPNGVPIVAGNKKGSRTLTVGSTADFTVGSMILIMFEEQTNDAAIKAGAIPVVSVVGFNYKGNQGSLIQMVEVKAKTASTLTIFPPILRQHDAGLAAKAFAGPWVNKDMGVEDLVIDCEKSAVFAGIYLQQGMGCWVKNIKILNTSNYGIYFQNGLNCEVRGCEIRLRKGGGSNGSGLLVNSTTASLFEDNIIVDVFPCVEVNAGSTGNVFGYNVLENGPLNLYGGRYLFDTLIANHGPHNCFNLYEGNVTANIKWDGYFGGASEDTVFRNWIHGSHKDREMYTYITSFNRFTRDISFVGNLLMRPDHTGGTDPYSFGNPNIGNGFSAGEASPSVGKFWVNWKTTATLTERSSDTAGRITVSAGNLSAGINDKNAQYLTIRSADGANATGIQAFAQKGAVIAFNNASAALPSVGTPLQLWWGSAGYQERDMDVRKTTLLKANRNFKTGVIPPEEALSAGETLPASLYHKAKPTWFGDLPFPAFDPANPFDATDPLAGYKRIPAGVRFLR